MTVEMPPCLSVRRAYRTSNENPRMMCNRAAIDPVLKRKKGAHQQSPDARLFVFLLSKRKDLVTVDAAFLPAGIRIPGARVESFIGPIALQFPIDAADLY